MKEILKIFEESGALLKGHFQLTSGLHSHTYFQCALVLQHPEYCKLLCDRIVSHFRLHEINTVISPAIGGIVVGQEVGRQLNVRTIFAERKDGEMKIRRGFTLNSEEKVLVCEDVVTTGGSVFEVIDLVKKAGSIVEGVGYIVDRSNKKVDFGIDQISVLNLNIETFSPATCPLCKNNIPVDKPGSRNS